MSYFNCHNHTHYSNIRLPDALSKPKDLIDKAIELGLSGIAITEHECLSSHMEINQYAKELREKNPNFTVALGDEIYLVDERKPQQKYYHFILIAKDAIGHKQLRELSSIAWLNSFSDRGMERVPLTKAELKKVILANPGHLIATSSCIGGEIGSSILALDKAEKEKDGAAEQHYYQQIVDFMLFCKSLFGDDFYLEVAPASSPEQIIVNKRIESISNAFEVPIVVGTDSHYISKDDRYAHKAFLNARDGEREVDSFYEFCYLMNEEETTNLLSFSFSLDAIQKIYQNSLELQKKIEFYDLFRKQSVTEVEVKNYPKSLSYFENLESQWPTLKSLFMSDNVQERYWANQCFEQLIERDIGLDKRYLDELEEEARIKRIIGEKLETCIFAYPNTLQHYIDLFWECGSTVGVGRGSSVAGLNHWLLGERQ